MKRSTSILKLKHELKWDLTGDINCVKRFMRSKKILVKESSESISFVIKEKVKDEISWHFCELSICTCTLCILTFCPFYRFLVTFWGGGRCRVLSEM